MNLTTSRNVAAGGKNDPPGSSRGCWNIDAAAQWRTFCLKSGCKCFDLSSKYKSYSFY